MRLRIALDPRYPGIIADTKELLGRGFPESSVGETRADRGATVVVSVYSSHLPCLFPQHGAGKKHERRIVLEPWQEQCVNKAPWRFIRGCIRSDGCSFVNVTGPYRYLSYDFCNYSEDILELFVAACERVGVEHRRTARRVRVNRRRSVALMTEHVGLKA